jgi:hypothetical protein
LPDAKPDAQSALTLHMFLAVASHRRDNRQVAVGEQADEFVRTT